MRGPRRVLEVSEGVLLLSEQQVAEELGLSTCRVRWLTLNGHLRRGVTPDGRIGGLTKGSVEHERAWRSGATFLQRLRRVFGYVFTWMP